MDSGKLARCLAVSILLAVNCYATDDQSGDESNVLTVYTIKCYEGELVGDECVGGYWLTNHPEKYRVLVDQQVVVSWFPNMRDSSPKKHADCAIASLDRWTCRFGDGSGEFGFRNGEYYSEFTNRTLEEQERERRFWGQIYVDEKRWLEVQERGGDAIREHRRRQEQQ